MRFLCVGFWHVNTMALCFKPIHGAVSSFGKDRLLCGLHESLAEKTNPSLHHRCNTR
jgi:hypothetical protein